ncbi:hypothetical protein QE422_004020 [Chryseobacterium sp. SORGH_AS 447]|uniref:hypothetical protein n=1 Tax=Chryseobacterium sp. SORGH_AS_0447 TaxID=3041769 RepID=UPI002789DEF8|nr:hypothetical protein [Chryseobacterium sp. SORGH_AS_0447]MDQ1163652.1 hypothetical protein [Chryseobacterium sp. SORGH_AS_0447]
MLTELDIKNVSLEKSPDSVNFCAAKTGLQLLKDIINNPILKSLIGTVVSLGDGFVLQNNESRDPLYFG